MDGGGRGQVIRRLFLFMCLTVGTQSMPRELGMGLGRGWGPEGRCYTQASSGHLYRLKCTQRCQVFKPADLGLEDQEAEAQGRQHRTLNIPRPVTGAPNPPSVWLSPYI